MDWITSEIAIGNYHEAQDVDLLRRHSIGSILGLIAALRDKLPADLGVQRIEILTLLDGPGNDLARFEAAVELLQRLVTESPPVLVHCRAGWSRSPAVVAGYLMRTRGLSPDDAIAAVAANRVFTMAPELQALLNRL